MERWIPREIESEVDNVAKAFPALALLGPRQSGKTSLARRKFPHHTYVSLEDLDRRSFAQEDPRGFLRTFAQEPGCILDEIQHVPSLFSYLQTHIDANPRPHFFILTGSQNFVLQEQIAQTLAGRIGILTLLPLTLQELAKENLLASTWETAAFQGFYPPLFQRNIPPLSWHSNYLQTYVERDVRNIQRIDNLSLFQKFLKLCAGRVGQLLNLSSLGNDCGIATNTAKGWISVLEASYILFLLPPYHTNSSKRLIKSPKLYFYDTGLLLHLLGIEDPLALLYHHLKGNLFESLHIADLIKRRRNQGKVPNLFFWRDKSENEIDCILEANNSLLPIEIKSGETLHADAFEGLKKWAPLFPKAHPGFVIYGGAMTQTRLKSTALSWKDTAQIPL